jgi:hypothetical protein
MPITGPKAGPEAFGASDCWLIAAGCRLLAGPAMAEQSTLRNKMLYRENLSAAMYAADSNGLPAH